MAVVTIIREIVRTAIRINKKYKYLNINDKFIRKYVPPGYRQQATRLARIGEGVALGIPIYEAIESGLRPTRNPSYRQNRQTRDNMEFPSTRRQFYKKRYNRYRRCYPRRKFS